MLPQLRASSLTVAALALAGAIAWGSEARADVVTFAQFTEVGAVQGTNFVFTRAADGFSAKLNTVDATRGDDVFFLFQSVVGLPTLLQGQQAAHLKINTGVGLSTTMALNGTGTRLSQPFNSVVQLAFTRDAAYVPTSGTKKGQSLTNLLTVTIIGNAAEQFSIDGRSASASATADFDSTNLSVTYSSDFLDFTNTVNRDGSLSFSAVSPSLARSGNFLRTFTADATGTFDSDPVPIAAAAIAVPVPEPAAVSLLLAGLLGIGAMRRRR